jgi:hypothetical protein
MTKVYARDAVKELFRIGNGKALKEEKWKERNRLDFSIGIWRQENTKQARSPQGCKERYSIHLPFAEHAANRNQNANVLSTEW